MRMVYGVAAGAEILLLVICALRAPKRKSDLAKIVCLYEWAVVFCGLSYYTFLYAGQAEIAAIGRNMIISGWTGCCTCFWHIHRDTPVCSSRGHG